MVIFSISNIIAQTYTPNNNILYVKKGAIGNGSSWNDAIGELSDALKWANKNKATFTTNPLQIWVAAGTYYPMYSPIDGDNFTPTPTDLRNRSFLLVNNVTLYGGFIGNETTIDQRNINNTTILSGDFNNNDSISTVSLQGGPTITNNSENAYHVLIATSNAQLNNFTVTNGNADTAATIKVNEQVINNNRGGAIYTNNTLTLNSSTLSNNAALNQGGAIYANIANIINSNITYNISKNSGGGIYANSTTLTNSNLSNNTASITGGAIFTSKVTLTNSSITNNISANASAIFSVNSISLINSTVIYNNGNTVFYYDGNGTKKFTSHNSIILNNLGIRSVFNAALNSKDIKYSLVQDESDTTNGNLDAKNSAYTLEKLFVNAADKNYNLKPESPLINAGSNELYTANGGNLATDKDLANNSRIFNSIIDLGSYEYQCIAPTLSGATSQTFEEGAYLSNLVVSPSNVYWYSSLSDLENNINQLTPQTTLLSNNTTYYAVIIDDNDSNCKSNILAVTVTVNPTLSTPTWDNSQMQYYPNPVSNILHINHKDVMNRIEVFSLVGQKLLEQNIQQNQAKINLSAYPQGIYLIKIYTNTNQGTLKIIKK